MLLDSSITSLLLVPIINQFLPKEYVEDPNVKMIISLFLSMILTSVVPFVKGYIFEIFKSLFTLSQKDIYLFINNENSFHKKLMIYYCKKNTNNIKGVLYCNENGLNEFIIHSLKDDYLEDTFENYKIKIYFVDKIDEFEKANFVIDSKMTSNVDNKKDTNKKNIVIKLETNSNDEIRNEHQILKDYINHVLHIIHSKNQTKNKIHVHFLNIQKETKKKSALISWQSKEIQISKNTTNTIVSDNVQTLFYNDLHRFLQNENYYIKKGLPYKRGYLLFGPPGTGKTSLIKAIANEYELPMFIIDLNMIQNNNQLCQSIFEIHNLVALNQKYLLVFEDVDRCSFFKKLKYGHENEKSITEDCFLNIIDGVDESHGRIVIFTCNTISVITQLKALMRPGRIDQIIKIDYCNLDQVIKMMQFYFEDEISIMDDFQLLTFNDISLSPAVVTQIILLSNNDYKTCLFVLRYLFQNVKIWNSNVIRNDNEELNKMLFDAFQEYIKKLNGNDIDKNMNENSESEIKNENKNENENANANANAKKDELVFLPIERKIQRQMIRLQKLKLEINLLEQQKDYHGGDSVILQLNRTKKQEQSEKLLAMIKKNLIKAKSEKDRKKLRNFLYSSQEVQKELFKNEAIHCLPNYFE